MVTYLENYGPYVPLIQNGYMEINTNDITPQNYGSYFEGLLNIMRDGIEDPDVQALKIGIHLEDGNFLTSNITDNLISIYDPKDQSNSLVLAFQDRHKKGQYTIPVIMQNYGSDFSDFKTKSTNLIVQEDKNKNFKLTQIVPTNKNDEDLVQGTLLKLEDFKSIQFTKFQYKVLDSNGNYTVDWEGNDTFYLWEISDKNGLKENSFEIRKQSLDDDGEYYCVFMITDIKNNTVYSNLIKIDN